MCASSSAPTWRRAASTSRCACIAARRCTLGRPALLCKVHAWPPCGNSGRTPGCHAPLNTSHVFPTMPQGLPYVINMTLPDRSEDYIHR